jgi:2-dehydro-3-deoxygalactonokinase
LAGGFFIAVDWGTSHLRAYLCQWNEDNSLQLLDQRGGPGVVKIDTDFKTALLNCICPWQQKYGPLPIFMAGQINSSIGWQVTPYLDCPIKPQEIANSCLNFDCEGHRLILLPGVRCALQNNLQDVMRGEELQILGFLQLQPSYKTGTILLCLPGTHTKWVLLKDGQINCFKTAMTGELFDLLCHQSVLIQQDSAMGDFDWTAFEQGCEFTLSSDSGNFVHGLFSVRTRQLSGEMTALQAKAYLSGVLIGSDVRAAKHAKEWQLTQGSEVVVIGTPRLNRCFATALSSIGVQCHEFDVQSATLSGFSELYQLMKQTRTTCL